LILFFLEDFLEFDFFIHCACNFFIPSINVLPLTEFDSNYISFYRWALLFS
jgi:hypothetical protein